MNAHAQVDQIKFWFDSIVEIETALIGGVILHPEALGSVLQTGLEAAHFGDLGCASLWQRIEGIVSRGGAIDHRTVLQGGAGLVVGEGASPGAFLAKIMAEAARANSLAEYASIVRSAWVIRRVFDAADKARDEVAGADSVTLARSLIETVDGLRDSAIERSGSTRGSLGKIAAAVGLAAQEMLQGTRERPPATGLSDLDKHLPMGGLAPGSLIILAGRTGQGKTLVASALGGKMATRGKGAIYFSLEVPASEISARIICERIGGRGPVYGDVLAGKLTEDQLEKFIWASAEAEKLPLHIDDTPALTIQDIHLAAKKQAATMARADTPLSLVIIDHAQIVKGSSRHQGNRVGELGEIANGAKVMAKQLGCAVVLCCQLNRGVEARDDKRPMLSDLRASGELEEAADAVLMLYREAYYLERSQAFRSEDPAAIEMMAAVRNQIEIGIEKSRQGSTGRATLWCDPGRSILADQQRWS
ncbi:replicative DNA helicase [Bosea sp. 2KB_26]|uniref:replicative DNA helicase n=1 Tax=Bosea sp. 2KB_26 TaxID=3237475 RepID=UPI003F8F0D1B